jgi:hypothetical protein
MRRIVVGIAMVASLWVVGSASAATVSGAVDDPQGDKTAPVATGFTVYKSDLKRFAVTYDSATGRMTGTVDFWDAQPSDPYGYPWFNFYATLGVYRNGGCDTTSAGAAKTHFYTPDDAPVRATPPDARIVAGQTIAGTFSAPAGTWYYEFSNTALVGRGYSCVGDISLRSNSGSVDTAPDFCLGPCTHPVAPTGLVAAVASGGVSLSWARSPDPSFSYFAVRRGTQADPDAGAWTRLTSNYTAPSATDSPGPGTWFYYVTEIDTAAQVSARSAVVRVVVPAATAGGAGNGTVNPVTTPAPTPAPSRSGTTPGTVPDDGTPTSTTSGSGARGGTAAGTPVATAKPDSPKQTAVTRTQARRVAALALKRAVGKTFAKRTRYTAACTRKTARKWSCTVAWRHGRKRYGGKVVVLLSPGKGYTTTVSVRRLSAPR